MLDRDALLVPVLSSLLERIGTSPIRLDVCLSDPDEIARLKEQISTLELYLRLCQEKCDRVENLYAHESAVNNRLLDFIRDNGLTVPKSLFRVES